MLLFFFGKICVLFQGHTNDELFCFESHGRKAHRTIFNRYLTTEMTDCFDKAEELHALELTAIGHLDLLYMESTQIADIYEIQKDFPSSITDKEMTSVAKLLTKYTAIQILKRF